MKFVKATKKQARARIALQGPGGSGKTWTALELATGLGSKIAVIDSERGSASKYSDRFAFDVLELETYGPEKYIEAIHAAEAGGYDVVVIDSLSHAWAGRDGILERVDRKGGFAGWKDVTPLQNRLTDTILNCKAHVIATLRVKTEYAVEQNDRGKMAPRKVGLAPVQKDGLEYEFDVVGSLDANNNLSIEKTRCSALNGRAWKHQNREVATILRAWLTDGALVAIEPSPANDIVAKAKEVFPGAKEVAEDPRKKLGSKFTTTLGWKKPAIVAALKERYGVETLSALSDEQVADCNAYVDLMAEAAK